MMNSARRLLLSGLLIPPVLLACSDAPPTAGGSGQGAATAAQSGTNSQDDERPVMATDSHSGNFHMRCILPAGGIPLNEDFDLEVYLTNISDGSPLDTQGDLRIAARMPAHGHGMKHAPTVEALADGKWKVSGMLFHMSGHWELHCDLTRGALTERAQLDIDLE